MSRDVMAHVSLCTQASPSCHVTSWLTFPCAHSCSVVSCDIHGSRFGLSHGLFTLPWFSDRSPIHTGGVAFNLTGVPVGAPQKVQHTGCTTESASHWVHHRKCSTLGASQKVHHTGCITESASHWVHHRKCITLGAPQWCITESTSHWVCHNGASQRVHHTGCTAMVHHREYITLGALQWCITESTSHWVCHNVHHTGCTFGSTTQGS